MGQTKKETNTDGIPEALARALKSRNREEIQKQIRQGALREVPEERKEALYQELISLRDMGVLDALAKERPTFTPEFFRMDFKNYNNLEFVRSALTKYRKKFDWQDEKVREQLFDMAMELGDTKTLIYFMKQKWMKEKYPRFGGSTDEVFRLLEKMAPLELDSDEQVELLYQAAVSAKGVERLKLLRKYGYDLDEKNSDQKTAKDLLEKRVKSFSYPKNRAGEMAKNREKQAIAYLNQKEVQVQEEKKDNRKKWMIAGACILLAAVISYAVGYQHFASVSKKSEETSAEEVEDTTTETGTAAEETTETETVAEETADTAAETGTAAEEVTGTDTTAENTAAETGTAAETTTTE